ncbi:MAG: hypothetical protein IPO40_11645 [Fibrobacteres bacterium]|nr:hypothetical protein [Fibrobacterota bacterium]
MRELLAPCLILASSGFAHVESGSLSIKSGTTYSVGQKVSISWAASVDHNKSPYTVSYSIDAGKTWTSIKSNVPGQATGVRVLFEWTVPSQITRTGMIRVFQTAGGTPATDPAKTDGYTLFSPVFEVQAVSAVAQKLLSGPPRTSIRFGGNLLDLRIEGTSRTPAIPETLHLDGSRR